VLGHSPDALDLIGISDIEGLYAAVIEDVPQLDHAFGVSRDKTVQIGQAVHTDQGVLVTVQSHDRPGDIRVPDKDIEFEAAADDDFVLLAIGHLANGSLVANQGLDRRDGRVTEDLVIDLLVFEIVLNLVFHLLLESLFFRAHVTASSFSIRVTVHLLLAQVPKMNLTIVVACGKLINIR